MNILVTGGAGFVGSYLTERLLRDGHHVMVVDDLSTGTRENLPEGVLLCHRSISEPLDDLFDQFRPALVYHLAGQVSVPRSVLDPRLDLQVNVDGVINLIETGARFGVRKLIAMSSAAVYGHPDQLPVTEESPTVPLSPYGLSKLSAEQYIRMLGGLRGIAYTIIRPANIFGPRQMTKSEGAVIPAFLERFLAGHDPVVHGAGDQTRDFLFVADMVEALIRAINRADGLTLNVSSGQGVSVMELWTTFAGLLGWHKPPVYGPPRAGDIPHSILANALARRELGWAPRYSLAAGLAETLSSVSSRDAAAAVDLAR